MDSSKLWITFRKAPQSWVYFQIPRGFPPRDATSTPSPPKSNYSGIFLYKTPQQLCWMGANVGKCSLHRARIISSSLSHSDPSLDPTELLECWDFNGAPAPSTWDPWSIPQLSHSSLCSPVLPWNSARPARPSSGTSDKTAALPLTNPWKPGQRAGNAAQGAHWQGGKAVIPHSSLRCEVLGIRGAGIVGITALLT